MFIRGNNLSAKPCPRFLKKCAFSCYEGFCIYSTDFRGNKNIILANISKSKNAIKNRGHGFLLLFNLTSWSQKQLKNLVAFWSWSSKLVIKCTKYNANFTPLDKMSKLWFINQFIVFSLYLYREIKKKLKKRFFSNYWR